MEQESRAEFDRRWVETAEADLRIAKRKFVAWLCLYLAAAAAWFSFSGFAHKTSWRIAVDLLLSIPFVVLMFAMVSSSSKVQDAKRFLKEFRNNSTNENEKFGDARSGLSAGESR
jgi:hypothetical protein